jgi:hypothetical protein
LLLLPPRLKLKNQSVDPTAYFPNNFAEVVIQDTPLYEHARFSLSHYRSAEIDRELRAVQNYFEVSEFVPVVWFAPAPAVCPLGSESPMWAGAAVPPLDESAVP